MLQNFSNVGSFAHVRSEATDTVNTIAVPTAKIIGTCDSSQTDNISKTEFTAVCSLLSEDCLIRLKVIDPKNFLDGNEVKANVVNSVLWKSSKLSTCEKSFRPKEDGTVGCDCPTRSSPPKFKQSTYENVFNILSAECAAGKTDLNVTLAAYLEHQFKASSMNICQTQPLSKMNVDKMTVEFHGKATLIYHINAVHDQIVNDE